MSKILGQPNSPIEEIFIYVAFADSRGKNNIQLALSFYILI